MSSRLKMAAAKITNSESSDLLRKSSRIVSTPESARKTWSEVVKAADEKQAERILVLDVSESLSICGNFVLMSAHNTRLVQTLAEFIEEKLIHAGPVDQFTSKESMITSGLSWTTEM